MYIYICIYLFIFLREGALRVRRLGRLRRRLAARGALSAGGRGCYYHHYHIIIIIVMIIIYIMITIVIIIISSSRSSIVGADDCTPEIAKVKFRWKVPLNIHWTFAVTHPLGK